MSEKMARLVSVVVRSNSVPWGMEPKPERNEPAGRVQGRVVAQSNKNDVSLVQTLVDLQAGGYRLVEKYYEERETEPGKWSKKYYLLTYVFARADGQPSFEFTSFMACLDVVVDTTWQVRVYRNPLFRDGVAVPGEFTLSVNCHKRQPLYNDDGTPTLVWNDERTEKVPLEPACNLVIDGDTASFVTAQ